MILKPFDQLPEEFQNDRVREYYDILRKRKLSIAVKRIFDIFVSLVMLVILSPLFLVIAVAVKLDSPGTVFYRQKRITSYKKEFGIYKFRTMVSNADKIGTLVTVENDSRITRTGKFLRKFRLDEIPQLINILKGEMSFVGTRPEVSKYVAEYTEEMYATLLLPAGVTSLASIRYKDEEKLLSDAEDADLVYTSRILPEKMVYNLEYLKKFSIWHDCFLMIQTVFEVIK